jgi:hypothetical protein
MSKVWPTAARDRGSVVTLTCAERRGDRRGARPRELVVVKGRPFPEKW